MRWTERVDGGVRLVPGVEPDCMYEKFIPDADVEVEETLMPRCRPSIMDLTEGARGG